MSNQDMTKTLSLTAKGLIKVPMNQYEYDFTFFIDGHEHHCPSFVAAFLSPRVCDLQRNDSTIRSLHLETKDPENYFKSFLSLGFGFGFEVPSQTRNFVFDLCRELRNAELYESLFNAAENKITKSNVIDRILTLSEMKSSYESEIAFVASHFFEFSRSDFSELNLNIISDIVGHQSLKLRNEDSLYEFISTLISEDSNYSSLLEFVRFEYLSNSSIRHFVDFISSSFEFLTFSIWETLSNRLVLNVSPASSKDRHAHRTFAPSSPFDGIISYLTRKHQGNVHELDIVRISASSVSSGTLKSLADLNTPCQFYTNCVANSWICYDFNTMQINLTHYSIRTQSDENAHYLRNWVVEGSIDGSEWTILDQRNNNLYLAGLSQIVTFSVSQRNDIRMVRIRQTGKDSSGSDYLESGGFEFFGYLVEIG
jgi:hypothetical protein